MIWQNVLAFAGLLALALPVLIHLLSRRRAVLHRFPSLRFLNVSRLLPTRSPNISDVPLLLVRLGVFAAAVAALAQPLWLSPSRTRSLNSALARAIVLDTSVSMRRAMPGGMAAADSARSAARQLALGADASVTLQTTHPGQAIPGAIAWLKRQGSRGEVVIVSDFQTGSVDSATITSIQRQYGVRLLQITGNARGANATFRTTGATVTATFDSSRTSAEWQRLPEEATTSDPRVQLLTQPGDEATARLVERAAQRVAATRLADTTPRVTVVFPHAAGVATLLQGATLPTHDWVAEAMLRIRRDEVLQSAAAEETVADTTLAAPFVVLARTDLGAPVVFGAQDSVGGAPRLLLVQRAGVRSLSTAALLAAVHEAIATGDDVAEFEPAILSSATLQRLQRAPGAMNASDAAEASTSVAHAGLSDGRWFWVLVLALLLVEWVMRRDGDKAAGLSTA